MYVVWRIWGAFDVHCGYELPWSPHRILPFSSKMNNNIHFTILKIKKDDP